MRVSKNRPEMVFLVLKLVDPSYDDSTSEDSPAALTFLEVSKDNRDEEWWIASLLHKGWRSMMYMCCLTAISWKVE
jgi:hypothetical protein